MRRRSGETGEITASVRGKGRQHVQVLLRLLQISQPAAGSDSMQRESRRPEHRKENLHQGGKESLDITTVSLCKDRSNHHFFIQIIFN